MTTKTTATDEVALVDDDDEGCAGDDDAGEGEEQNYYATDSDDGGDAYEEAFCTLFGGRGGGAAAAATSSENDADAATAPAGGSVPPPVLRVAVGSKNPSKIRAVRQFLERVLRRQHQLHQREQHRGRVPALDVRGYDVESGVPDQPFGDAETREGATNRAKAAYRAYYDHYCEDDGAGANGDDGTGGDARGEERQQLWPHLGIGMEGGLEWVDRGSASNAEEEESKEKELFCMAWMAVYGKRTGTVVDWLASRDTESYAGDKKPVLGVSKTASFAVPPEVARLVRDESMELGRADDVVFRRVNSKHGGGTVGKLTDDLVDRSEYYEHALILAFTPWLRPNLYPDGIP